MAFRFRRTMKIAPGLRLNLTHRGVSARIGPRGLGWTINANGRQHIGVGIPGSGIHVSEQIKPARRKQTAQQSGADAPPAVEAPAPKSFDDMRPVEKAAHIATVMILSAVAGVVVVSLFT